MKPAIIKRLHKNIEDYVHVQEGIEFWFARDLQKLLGYDEWRNFLNVVQKSKGSCVSSGNTVADHFVDANKMVTLAQTYPVISVLRRRSSLRITPSGRKSPKVRA
jgi:DNA-damage-inducible protein D